ncbi:hypothetical protein EIN_517030 [Entamoeba invadens IP1]|uniref:Leucine rich repeat containing protein BspA family protein n=1 Tax=Entamoeba invadens IP1 TaxID=370355 RepID=L7FMT6_ENTIV|nr:hypothetical protein EIN_517030 [Entamoeba invadens IP1]ELP86807.1 hypothetical protein EIN_517030 [Entamoeba invadens IP1]|eukprot:XP_004253578.1 hypothetical protein EIN_517030 [Entamoeba invadens IP1]
MILEEFYLMNVVLYINTFDSFTNFVCVNKKCQSVMRRMQRNSFIIDKFPYDTAKNPTRNFLCYFSRLSKFFPHAKTLCLPSYSCLIPQLTNFNFSLFEVSDFNDAKPIPISEGYEYYTCYKEECFITLDNFKEKSYFLNLPVDILNHLKTVTIYSLKTAEFFIQNVYLFESCNKITLCFDNTKVGDENMLWKILVDNKSVLWRLKNLKKFRIFLKDLNSIEMLLKFIEDAPTLDICIYIQSTGCILNREKVDMTNTLNNFTQLMKIGNVIFRTIENVTEFVSNEMLSKVPVSVINMPKTIEMDDKMISQIVSFTQLYALVLDQITLTVNVYKNIDMSKIECKKLVIINKIKSKITLKISPVTCVVKCNKDDKILLYSSQNVTISLQQYYELTFLDVVTDINFFVNSESDSGDDESDSEDQIIEVNKNIKLFEKISEQIEILNFTKNPIEASRLFEVSQTPVLVPQTLNIKKLSEVAYCSQKDHEYIPRRNLQTLFNCSTNLTSLKIENINGEHILNKKLVFLDKFRLKNLQLKDCRNCIFELPNTLTGLSIFNTNNSNYYYGKETIYLKSLCLALVEDYPEDLTHYNIPKNVVVDYTVQFDELKEYPDESYYRNVHLGAFKYKEIRIGVYPFERRTFVNTKTWNKAYEECRDSNNTIDFNKKQKMEEETVFVLENNAFQGEQCCFDFGSLGRVKEIGDFCFKNCTCFLNDLYLPYGLTKIGYGAFQNITTLEAVHLNESITKLPYKCFAGDIYLKEITSPLKVVEVDEYALWECKILEKYPKFVPSKCVKSDDWWTLKFCNITKLEVPEYVDEHLILYLKGLTSLKCVNIKNTMCLIGKQCFVGCSNIKNICLNESVRFDKHLVFANLSSLTSITLPTTLTKIRNFMFKNCIKLKDVIIKKGVVKIGDSAFQNCESLKKVNIPQSVTKIGLSCFKGCISLCEICCSSSLQFPLSSLFGVQASFNLIRYIFI